MKTFDEGQVINEGRDLAEKHLLENGIVPDRPTIDLMAIMYVEGVQRGLKRAQERIEEVTGE